MSHLSSLAKKDQELYKKAISLPFISDRDKFKKVYQELKDSPELSDNQSKYLEKRYNIRELWAKAYLKSSYGGGISTTSRVESFHAKLKKHLTSSSNLQKVFVVFRQLEQIQIERFKEEFLRHGEITSIEKLDFITKIKEDYSQYVSMRIFSKFLKALNYSNEKKRNCDVW